MTSQTTTLALAFAAILFSILHARAQPASAPPSRPAFSWETVPLYMHIGKRTAFTDDEIAHIARFPLITIEKATGLDAGTVEAGTQRAARRIKAANPDATVLAYFNVLLDYPGLRCPREIPAAPRVGPARSAGRPHPHPKPRSLL